MAEAAQRAGIEINLQIAGIEDLENVHNKVNSLVNDLPKLKESMNGLHMNLDFGEKAENQINELNTNLGRTNQILKEVHTDAQNIANPLRSDSEQAETLTSKFRTTKDTVNDLTGNIKNAGNDTKQVGENARQIDEPFKQVVNILSEMSGDIKKVVDFQHQQTTAVKETNSSLRDVVGINEKIYSGQGRQTEAIKTTNVQIGQTRMAIGEISRAQEGVTSDVKETESATSGWKDKLSGLKEKLNVKGTINEDNESAHRFGGTLESLQSKAEKTSHLFGKMLGANLISNGISNAFASITSHIGEAKEAVVEYNDKQQVMNATWETLTGNAKKGQAMVDVGNDMSKAYGQNIEVVDELNQKFYHVFNNKDQTEQLTKSVLTLGDTLGMSDANVQRLGENFTHMMTSGKMQMGDFNHISDQLPMFGEKLLEQQKKIQHNSGLTMQQLQKQMSAGKISAKDAEDVMNELGGKYQKASENLMKTLPGMRRMIKTQSTALADAIYQPIANMKNPIFEGVSKWVQDPRTTKEFKAVGSNIANQITRITKVFDIKSVNVTGGLDSMMKNLNTGITNLGNVIIKNKDTLKDFFKVIKEGSGGGLKVFVEMLKIMEPLLKVTADAAAKHPKIFAAMALSMLSMGKAMQMLTPMFTIFGIGAKSIKGTTNAVKGLSKGLGLAKNTVGKNASGIEKAFSLIGKGAKGAGKFVVSFGKTAGKAFLSVSKAIGKLALDVVKAMAKMAVAMATNPFGLAILGITALIAAVALAYAKIKPFRDFINGLGKMIVNVFKGVIDFFKNNWKEIGLLIINPFWGISAMLYKNVKPFRDFVNNVFGVIKSGFGAIGNFFSGFWNGTVKIFNAGIKLVTNVWNSGWNFIKNVVVGIFNGISSFFGGVWNSIKAIFSVGLNFVSKLWESEWNGMKNIGVTIWNFITGFIGGFWNGIKSIWNGSLNWISKVWSDSWEGIFKFGKWIWDMISGTIGGFWNGIKNVWNSSIVWVSDVWNKGWTAIFDFGKGIWNGISNFIGGFWGGLKSIFKTAGDDISGIWNGTWQGVSDMFGSIWKGIKKIAQDGINGLIDVLNAGIDGIDWVVNKFGGPKEAIGKVKPVKFAAGTGGVTRDTLAMLNDGNDSPETGNKEMAILPNGKTFIPQKRNWTGVLPAGTEVLNAKETKMLMSMQGVTHFADGTGLWDKIVDTTKSVAGDVWGEIKDFGKDLQQGFDIATKIVSDPGKYLNDKFKSPDLKGDLMLNLGKGMFDKTKDAAGSFWNETWSAVGDILGSGGGSGSMGEFLSEAKRIGMGKPYVMGATGPDAFDCSGLVMKALQKFGINIGRTTVAMQTSSGVSGLGKDISKAKPGDLAIFGHGGGAAGHVGIVDNVNKHTMMNATPPKGTVSSIDDVTSVALDQYYHVKGLHSDDAADKKKSSSNAGVSGLVHKMFDSNMFKWIKDFLAPLGDNDGDSSATGPAPKGDHMNWLKQAGIPDSEASMYDYIVSHESGWNPHARNSNGGAYGLPQSLPGSKMASAGSDWKDNPITQLKWMKSYVKDRYGGIKGAYDYWHVHHNYENGGFVDNEQIARIGENNKLEAVVPMTQRNRAFEILRNIFSIMKPNKSEQDGLGLGNSNKNTSTMPGSDFYSPSTNTSSDNKDLSVGNYDKETLKELKKANQLNKQMFNAMLELADLSKEQIAAIKGSKTDIDDINKQQGSKFAINNYQLGGG